MKMGEEEPVCRVCRDGEGVLSPNCTETGLGSYAGSSFHHALLHSSPVSGDRTGRNRECPHMGHQNVRVVDDTG